MIVEIESSRPSCGPSLDYNEGKVLRGVAELVAYANMEDISAEAVRGTFTRLENRSARSAEGRSFHASVNPSAEDGCTETQVLEFISGMMSHLGYGRQPYVVYRHFDIEREHYHIVSVRIDADGRKINDWFEKRRVTAYMRENAHRFGFSMAEKGSRVLALPDISDDGGTFLRFNPNRPVLAQARSIVARALGYDFGSFAQFSCILEDMGLAAAMVYRRDGPSVAVRGLDRDGVPVTSWYGEGELWMPVREGMEAAVSLNAARHRERLREKRRIGSLAGFAFDISRSEGHFVNILRRKGIGVHFSRTRASGDIFGVTFVDHSTGTVFKASELRDGVSVKKIQEAVSTGKWHVEEKGRGKRTYVRTAREDALRLRDLHVGATARVLRPAGQPTGASWSGKDRREEGRRGREKDGETSGAVNVSFEDRRYEERIR